MQVEQVVRGICDVDARNLVARIVDQDVQPSETGDRFRDQAIERTGFDDVAVDYLCLAPGTLQTRKKKHS